MRHLPVWQRLRGLHHTCEEPATQAAHLMECEQGGLPSACVLRRLACHLVSCNSAMLALASRGHAIRKYDTCLHNSVECVRRFSTSTPGPLNSLANGHDACQLRVYYAVLHLVADTCAHSCCNHI